MTTNFTRGISYLLQMSPSGSWNFCMNAVASGVRNVIGMILVDVTWLLLMFSCDLV